MPMSYKMSRNYQFSQFLFQPNPESDKENQSDSSLSSESSTLTGKSLDGGTPTLSDRSVPISVQNLSQFSGSLTGPSEPPIDNRSCAHLVLHAAITIYLES